MTAYLCVYYNQGDIYIYMKMTVYLCVSDQVDIEINGQPVGLHMKLGEAGEAFFVLEVPEDEEEVRPTSRHCSVHAM